LIIFQTEKVDESSKTIDNFNEFIDYTLEQYASLVSYCYGKMEEFTIINQNFQWDHDSPILKDYLLYISWYGLIPFQNILYDRKTGVAVMIRYETCFWKAST